MKTILLSVFSLFVTFAIASTDPVTGTGVDVEKSTIEWTGKKVTGKHEGTINLKSADLSIDNGMITGGNFVIDMTSIQVTDLSGGMADKLRGHLTSDDFFGVASHPTATLEISGSEKGEEAGTQLVKGNLTIKNITHPIEFVTSMNGNTATAKITVDRSKYDVRYGSKSFFEGLGDNLIYDNFDLNVTLVLK